MKVTGFRNLLPLVTKLFSTPVLRVGGFMVALGSLFFLRWWTPYAIRSRCGAPSRHGLQRQSGLALHDHQQAGDMSPACGTPSDRAAVFALQSAPLSLCLPADPNHNFYDAAKEGVERSPWFQPKVLPAAGLHGQGRGFPALLTQRPHLTSCPFNAANVCNASSTNIGAIPLR